MSLTTKPVPMTAAELAAWVERIPPVILKNVLYDQLVWQSKHGRRPGHIRQYLEAAYRKHVEPRLPISGTNGRTQVQTLIQGIGKP